MATGKRVALLRGINVGRAKRIAMADLRRMMEELGYQDVRTLLNSGNVVFTTAGKSVGDDVSRIEEALVAKLGVSSRVIVLTAAELAAIVANNPLVDLADNPSRMFVAVLRNDSNRKQVEPMLKEDWKPDVLALGKRVVYMWCPDGLLESRLVESIGRVLRDSTTIRNWATTLKLNALANDQK